MFFTVHRPPWALAIASTIASPSPTPPADRVRAASARAKRSKIRVSASSGIPQPSSSTSISNCAAAPLTRAQLDRVVPAGVLDRVLDQRVERRAQPVGIGGHRTGRDRAESPRPWRDLGPAHEHVLEERLDLDALDLHEVGLVGGREQQKPSDDRVDPPELVERDLELGVVSAPEQQLEVATGDRYRSAQLVRGVVHEPLLALEHRAPLLGARLRDTEGVVTTARVPHHQHDDDDQQRSGAQDRLPVGPGDDRGVARDGERRPQELHSVASK